MMVLLLIAAALPFITAQVLSGAPQFCITDLADPNVRFAVNAINEFYKTNGDPRPRVGEKVVLAQCQVVAGMIYTYVIEVKVVDMVPYQNELCTIAVWRKPWLPGNDSLLVDGTPDCLPEVLLPIAAALQFITARDIPGAPHLFVTNLADPRVAFAVKTINESYTELGPVVGEKVVFAIRQVVAGENDSSETEVVATEKDTFEIEVKDRNDVHGLCIVDVRQAAEAPFIAGQSDCVLKIPV